MTEVAASERVGLQNRHRMGESTCQRALLSFHSDPCLKASVLNQMEAHARACKLDEIVVVGSRVDFYRIGVPLGVALGARLLALPEQLLVLGFSLFDGFPETGAERREFAELRRSLIEAFPVGADLSGAAGLFFHRLLGRDRYRFEELIHTRESAALRREVLDALYADPRGAFLDEPLRVRLRLELERERQKVPEQWAAHRTVDPAVTRTLRALETLEAVSRLPVDLDAAAEAAQKSVYGANGVDVKALDEVEQALRELFVEILKAPPG